MKLNRRALVINALAGILTVFFFIVMIEWFNYGNQEAGRFTLALLFKSTFLMVGLWGAFLYGILKHKDHILSGLALFTFSFFTLWMTSIGIFFESPLFVIPFIILISIAASEVKYSIDAQSSSI